MKEIFYLFLISVFIPVNADLNLDLPDLNLPSLGDNGNSFTTSFDERRQGKRIIRKLRSGNTIIEDPEINSWIRSLGYKLSANAPQTSSPFYFLVSNNSSINAYATLGGVIVIHAGLILRTNSESELAAVVSHEIAHVTQHHISRMLQKQSNNKLATNAALIAGILASGKNPQAGQAIISTTIATLAHKQLTFNREAEAEADRVGIRILSRAGFNPMGMPTFLNKLEQFTDSQQASTYEYLRSHPLTLKRVTDTKVRAKQLGSYKGKENIRYLYMREKIRSLVSANGTIPTNIPKNIQKYSRSLQLTRNRNYRSALEMIGTKSNNVSEALLMAKLLNKHGRYKQSINILLPLNNIYPGDVSLSVSLAQAYKATSQLENAWKTINDITISEQTSLEYFEILQNIAKATRRLAQAYHSAANKNIRMGNYKSALSQLRHAIKLPSVNNNTLKMEQQLEEIEATIKNDK